MAVAGPTGRFEPDRNERKALRPAQLPGSGGRFSIVHMMLLVGFCAVFFRLSAWIGWVPVGIVSVFLLCVLGVASVITLAARRETQQDALLWVLTIAAERHMPLAPGIEAVADQYGGLFRRRVLALAEWLKSGVSLPDALMRVPGTLPQSALVLTRVGLEVGNLAGGLRAVVEARAARPSPRHPLMSKLAYLCCLLLCIQLATGFIIYFVLPKMERIYADFGVRLPELTLVAVSLGHTLFDGFLLPFFILLELMVLLYLPLFYLGWVNLPVPFIDRLARRRHTGVVLRALALVVDAGWPLRNAVALLSRDYPVWWVRTRLRRVRRSLDEGADWCDCLRWHGLIRAAEAAVLESAQRADNLSWALRELAESGERRLAYHLLAWTQALFPVVVVSMGVLVFLFAVAYFNPLIKLIEEFAKI